LGIDEAHAIASASPEEKLARIGSDSHGPALMVGDGVNDSLAVNHAHVSGTPLGDRPYMAARADFCFTTPGIAPIRLGLRTAKKLSETVRRTWMVAALYNIVAVSLAVSGRLSPLACAVLMPLSSLSAIALVLRALSRRSPHWKPSTSPSS
jgi:Cu2+-exporting ATPase